MSIHVKILNLHLNCLVCVLLIVTSAETPTSTWVGNHETQYCIQQSTVMLWFQCNTL